jgi:hypothetical protein
LRRQGDKEHKIGSSDFVRCENGHVMLADGRCRRVLPVTCRDRFDETVSPENYGLKFFWSN